MGWFKDMYERMNELDPLSGPNLQRRAVAMNEQERLEDLCGPWGRSDFKLGGRMIFRRPIPFPDHKQGEGNDQDTPHS